jgi:DNA repair protein RecO (recombination protein O)
MHLSASAILCAARPHGETAVIARLLTERHGLVAGYVAGGRGRQLRPVLIPGNRVALELNSKSEGQLPYARLELVESRGPWLTEPLPAAAIGWATALTAAALPERHAYPALYAALVALLDAVCHAPAARGWVPGMVAYEALLLRELGYGGQAPLETDGEWAAILAQFDRAGRQVERYLLADRRSDVMGARAMLRERLARIGGPGTP